MKRKNPSMEIQVQHQENRPRFKASMKADQSQLTYPHIAYVFPKLISFVITT